MELLNLNFHYVISLEDGHFYIREIVFCLNSILRQNEKKLSMKLTFPVSTYKIYD